MKTGKKLLSVILSLMLVLGAVAVGGISVSAEETYSVGDTFYYGAYPQSDVTDSLSSVLNSYGGTWKSYNYYSGKGALLDNGRMTASDYMRYKDVTYNGSKYRGVIFDNYRPFYTGFSSSEENSIQVENGYNTGTTYWFKYEPIKWRVLDPSTGFVMCDSIIDSQPYNNYLLKDDEGDEYWGDSAQTYYANNYAESSIRQWLNDDFYNTAFSDEQKSNIIVSDNLDNSCPADSNYNSPSTSDKIFILSYNEARNSVYGFDSYVTNYDAARILQGSDYARCQGLMVSRDSGEYDGCSAWWLRTPDYHSDKADCINMLSKADSVIVSHTGCGVVPVLKLQNLNNHENDAAHNHIDNNGDLVCDICNVIYRSVISENETITVCIPAGGAREVLFTCERTGKYEFAYSYINDDDKGIFSKGVFDSQGNYIEFYMNRPIFHLVEGETYYLSIGCDSSVNNESTDVNVSLSHIHEDLNNDCRCDACNKIFCSEIKKEIVATKEYDPDENAIFFFISEEDCQIEIECSLGDRCLIYNQNYERVYYSSYNYTGNPIYEFEKNEKYIIEVNNYYSNNDKPIEIKLSHVHTGLEEYIVEPGIASWGVKSLTCSECGRKDYEQVRCTGTFEKNPQIYNGLIYYTFTDGADSEILVAGCTRDAGSDVVIPAEINGTPVASVGGWEVSCFFFNDKMEKLTITEGIRSINGMAFAFCMSLKEIILPESLECILSGDPTFEYCVGLEKISLGKGIKYLDDGCFWLYLSEINEYLNGLSEEEITEILEEECSNFVAEANEMAGHKFESLREALEYLIQTDEMVGDFSKHMDVYLALQQISLFDRFKESPHLNSFSVNFRGTEEDWKQIVLGKYFYETTEADIVFLGDNSGHEHSLLTITIPATCTESGVNYDICSECGEVLSLITSIRANGHTPGEWETVVEPTETDLGRAVKKCAVCGEILEEKELPKLKVIKDNETGVELVVDGEKYNGEVTVDISESFDGKAFNIVNTQTGVVKQAVYDIKMFVDGKETQPNGKVKIRIPLPAGYDPARTFVYYVNTATGKAEKINAVYENGFMVFETDHFSYYAVVDQTPPPNPTASAKLKVPSNTEVEYAATVTVRATASGVPKGYYVALYDGKTLLKKGSNTEASYTFSGEFTSTKNITVKIIDDNEIVQKDANGYELTGNVEIKAKSGFFAKLIAFFKRLFRILPNITVEPK